MSEYQYYEFVAIDRPLDDRELAEVRAMSTRAHLTATSFVNEYHWGSFRGDVHRMVERYYDAHLYLANWGTHQLMFRLPRAVLDLAVAEPYCLGDCVTAETSGERIILGFSSEDESGDWVEAAETSLSAVVGVRADLAAGDLRPLYLAWLAGYGAWERDEWAFDRDHDDRLEPPVPPGLRTLTAAQRAMADFLRLDRDLLHVAASASPDLAVRADDSRALAVWIAELDVAEKDRLLLRVAGDDAAGVRMELLRRFRDSATAAPEQAPRRTVADLLDGAARHRRDRERREAAVEAEQQARLEARRARERARRLDALARDQDDAWQRIEVMVATKKASQYGAAIELLVDLRDLAEREGRTETFMRQASALRGRHTGKPAFLRRLAAIGIEAGQAHSRRRDPRGPMRRISVIEL
ncbi:hypothetical protein [Nocardia sp. NPDC050710]|uniref:hypothetical protein n=1 Tax=Nocardia sp. NPDC050710 TaxID=3157220 RepID=UPI0033FEF9B6